MLCWLVYACSYIGKLSYNANISQIGPDFGVSYAECGMVSTFFFFAYGIGQVVNGFLCKRYNVKYVIFGSLAVASAMNISVTLVSDFSLIKYIWLINGVAMSFLWTSLIRLLSETLPDEDMNMAIIAMGTTVATGTFFVYGMRFTPAICTLLNLFIANVVVDYVLSGMKVGYKFEIITDSPDELSVELLEKLHHGVTEMRVEGKYSHTEKSMIVCIIRKKQIGEMMKIIKKYPGTFASYSKVNEVFGRFRK